MQWQQDVILPCSDLKLHTVALTCFSLDLHSADTFTHGNE